MRSPASLRGRDQRPVGWRAGGQTGRRDVDGTRVADRGEARELLARGEVGRVGITIGAFPAIFPVNYRLIDGAIVFRTAPGSKMSAAAQGAVVAFEGVDA